MKENDRLYDTFTGILTNKNNWLNVNKKVEAHFLRKMKHNHFICKMSLLVNLPEMKVLTHSQFDQVKKNFLDWAELCNNYG